MRVEILEYNTTVEFPDDMAPEKIQEILAKEFPSKEQSKAKPLETLYTGAMQPLAEFNKTILGWIPGIGDIYKKEEAKNVAALAELEKNPKNQPYSVGGQVLGNIGVDLPFILTGNIVGKAATKAIPQIAKLVPEAQAAAEALLSAPAYTASKKLVTEGRLPTVQEMAQDAAFFGGANVGGKVAGKVLPQTLPKLIKAPLTGAAEGVGGLLATNPADIQEYGPTAGAMALLKTAGTLGKRNIKPIVKTEPVKTTVEIPTERRINTELRKVIETAPESQKPAIVNIARNMEQWKSRAAQEGRSWVDVMREEKGIKEPVKIEKQEKVLKQPWQMTREEYNNAVNDIIGYGESKTNGESIIKNKSGLEAQIKLETGKLNKLKRNYENTNIPSDELIKKIEYQQNKVDQLKSTMKERENNSRQAWINENQGYIERAKQKYQNLIDSGAIKLYEGEELKGNLAISISNHKDIIKQAINEGKPIPQEVLKDYPDLANKYATTSIKSWPTMNKAGFAAPEEVYMAFQAKSKGKEWFKKEFASLPDSEQVYNQLVQKVDSLSPRDRSKFNFDIQFFAKNNPHFSKAAKERLINLYGAIPRGEAPRLRNVDVPAATDEGKTRQFARTAYEILPKEAARQTMEDVMAGKFAYEPLSNKESIRKAETEINTNADEAYQKWQGIINSGKRITADDIALGEALLTKAAKDKDLTKVSQLTIDLASEFTNAGQKVQYAQLLKKMSPEGYGVYVERQVKRVNREFKQKYGDKFKGFELSEADRKAILEAPTTEERERVAMDIAKRMAQEAPVSLMEKFNAWRRLMMLFNPRTHVRNIVGNVVFMPLRKATDAIGAGLEKILKVPEGKRTKVVGWAKDSSLVQLVDESWEANKKNLTSAGRWDISQVLGREKPIFKTKGIERLNQISKNTLEAEDVYFLRRAYRDALGQYLKANNLKTVTDAAVNYASRKAQKATYRDASALANLLSRVKREGGALGTALEALMPFIKTPINIARRGIEHSPIGLIQGLANYFGKVKEGKMEATEAIEQLAKGLTGTGAMMLGVILAKMGIITGAEDDDLDKAAFDKAVGKQPFAVNIGGHYYTWDWVQPISLPVAMGAQVYQSIKNNEGLVNSIISATVSGADVLLNLPLFQGIKKTLKGFALSPDYGAQSAANAIFDIFDSYVRQAVPVLGGQIARTFDRTIRTTYTPKGEKGILSVLGTRAQGFGKYVQSRIPGLSQQLPAKITTLGEKVEQPKSIAARAFLNFVSPGFYSKYKDSPAIKLVETVYKETGDKRIFPRVAPKTITVDNKKYILSAKEYSRFQQYIGQAAKEGYEQLASSGSFTAETNENKVKIMKKVLDDAFDIAKAKLMGEKEIESVSKNKPFKFGF